MSAITAGAILRQLALRRRQSEIARIAGLGDAECEAVVSALERVPAGSRVDVGVLISETRRRAADRAETARRRNDPLVAFRYELTLLNIDQLVALKGELERTGDVAASLAAVTQLGSIRQRPPAAPVDDAEPDDLDDEEGGNEPRPRSSLPRIRSRRWPGRHQDSVSAPPPAGAADEFATPEERGPPRRDAEPKTAWEGKAAPSD